MKLYYSKGACSLAVRITLHELGIQCDYEAVDLKTKKTATGEDYYHINPKGAVPALVLQSNEVLTENAVIQQYLADTYKATQVLPPSGDFSRYRVLEWLNYVSTDVHKSCGALFNANVPENMKAEIFRPLLTKKLDIIERHLSKHDYLSGNNFTLPDSYLFVVLRWLPHLGIDRNSFKNITRYFDTLKQRPSIQLAMQEEKISA